MCKAAPGMNLGDANDLGIDSEARILTFLTQTRFFSPSHLFHFIQISESAAVVDAAPPTSDDSTVSLAK